MEQSAGYHWDGSRKDPDAQSEVRRRSTLRLHRTSPSTALRADSVTRCRHCNHLIEFFDRFDGGRIPLMPHQFRSADIPERLRWSVNGGLAYLGDSGHALCRVPHPAVCPGVEHDDGDPELEAARTAHGKRTRKWIDTGEFTPQPREAAVEADVAEQQVDAGCVRHIMRYASWLWLGPDAIDAIQCVARANSTGQRCRNTVFDADLREGSWEQAEVPAQQGRGGRTLSGGLMWVYQLHVLGPEEIKRWMKQRCPQHAPGQTSTPDAIAPQWVRFDVWRHPEFVLHERPRWKWEPVGQTHPLLSRLADAHPTTQCAGESCRNGTVRTVEPGWLCWECERKHQRRSRIHRRLQAREKGAADVRPAGEAPAEVAQKARALLSGREEPHTPDRTPPS
ncbi:DUF6083 domain-containing protein [Bacillus cereus]|uniref:DUF6083 domain-containing protein n=1 Tax=Bacillus cereus TaxID=1396 RepID=UPI003D051E79